MLKRSMLTIALLSMIFLGAGHAFAQVSPGDAYTVAQGCAIRTDWPTHTVQRGDTLYNISRRAGTTVDALKAGNCLASNLIVVGSVLRVPNAITGPGTGSGPMIDIQQPASGTTLTSGQAFTVSGQARGLFEGSLVVQVRDSSANVLAQNAITAGGDVATGGTGPWSTSFTVNVPGGTSAMIYAYAISPRDGSVSADDRVSVTFGGGSTGCAVRSDWPVHVVQRGENLFRIGLRYNATVTALARANCLDVPGRIYAGQRLYVPAF